MYEIPLESLYFIKISICPLYLIEFSFFKKYTILNLLTLSTTFTFFYSHTDKGLLDSKSRIETMSTFLTLFHFSLTYTETNYLSLLSKENPKGLSILGYNLAFSKLLSIIKPRNYVPSLKSSVLISKWPLICLPQLRLLAVYDFCLIASQWYLKT